MSKIYRLTEPSGPKALEIKNEDLPEPQKDEVLGDFQEKNYQLKR